MEEKSYTKSKNRKVGKTNYGQGEAEFFEDETGVYNIVNMKDVWEIPYINSMSKERLGYPTQKPLQLLERIIKASCPEDGIVLDTFCGCGTTLESAITHKRKWIGVDISNNAIEVMKNRIENIVCDDSYTQHKEHETIHGNPETFEAYEKFTAYQKQEWTINTIGGFCNAKKSNDGG